MAQSHAIIEQYSESESSIEDNPVLGSESEIVIPLRTPQDQGKIKENSMSRVTVFLQDLEESQEI